MLAALPRTALAAETDRTYAQGIPGVPFQLDAQSPLLQVAAGDDQLISLVPGFTAPVEATIWSAKLDLGQPGVGKEFLGLFWTETTGHGTYLEYFYSVNGGAWQAAVPAPGKSGVDLPQGTHGRTIAYKVVFGSGDPAASPSLDDITITWRLWHGKPSPGGPSSDKNPGRPRHSGGAQGSGVYTYPAAASAGAGARAGSGGAGTGASGKGGSGTAGSLTGSAAAGAAPAPASQATPAAQPAPGTAVPQPPVSQPVGPATAVSGLAAAGASVSGMRLQVVAGSTATASLPGGGKSRQSRQLPLLGAGVAVAALLLVLGPWLAMAADIRAVSDPARWRRSRVARLPGSIGR